MDRSKDLDNQRLEMLLLFEDNDTLARLTYDGRAPLKAKHSYFEEIYPDIHTHDNITEVEEYFNLKLSPALTLDDYEEWNVSV